MFQTQSSDHNHLLLAINGIRPKEPPSTEDAQFMFRLEGLLALSSKELIALIHTAITELATDVIEKQNSETFPSGLGTTLNLTVIAKDVGGKILLICSNIGDSMSFLLIRNKETGLFTYELLNTLHHPDEPSEKIRLENIGADVERNRLLHPTLHRLKSIAITRAIGDIAFNPHLISTPDHTTRKIAPEELAESDIYLFTCSDGLIEEETLEQLIQRLNHPPVANNVMAITDRLLSANQRCWDDNSICASHIKPDSYPFIQSVADGHGRGKVPLGVFPALEDAMPGNSVAKYVTENLPHALAKHLHCQTVDIIDRSAEINTRYEQWLKHVMTGRVKPETIQKIRDCLASFSPNQHLIAPEISKILKNHFDMQSTLSHKFWDNPEGREQAIIAELDKLMLQPGPAVTPSADATEGLGLVP